MFVLVNIRSEDTRKNTYPLGLAYIAACLERYGDVRIFDFHFEDCENEFIEYIFCNQIRFVGFSTCSHPGCMQETVRLAKQVKIFCPHTLVGIGGPHPTYQGIDIISHHIEFDLAFIGEGEIASSQLGANLLNNVVNWFEGVDNIVYRDSQGNIKVPRLSEHDIACTPLPARHLLPGIYCYAKKYNQKVPVLSIDTSRGCPGQCSFCAFKNIMNLRHMIPKTDDNMLILRINLTKRNYQYIDDFIRLGKTWGYDKISFGFLMPFGRAKYGDDIINMQFTPELYKHITYLLEEYRENNKLGIELELINCYPKTDCNLIKTDNFTISPRILSNGDVFPCMLCQGPMFKLGNIHKNPISQILMDKPLQDLISNFIHRMENMGSCDQCIWNRICFKGCPAVAYSRYNTFDRDSGDCEFLKSHFSKAKVTDKSKEILYKGGIN